MGFDRNDETTPKAIHKITGDLNAHSFRWGGRRTCASGRAIESFLDKNGLNVTNIWENPRM
jgi:hypothetical protein